MHKPNVSKFYSFRRLVQYLPNVLSFGVLREIIVRFSKINSDFQMFVRQVSMHKLIN